MDAARRELAEEAGLSASTWSLLGDIVNSPGYSEEMCRIFLAEDVQEGTGDIEVEEAADEEADLDHRWVDISEAVTWVQEGKIQNSVAVAAVFHVFAGTRREVSEPFEYRSSIGRRRKERASDPAGADLKFVR